MKDFFDVSTEQSLVKTAIVQKYFDAWANIMLQRARTIAYIDLFSGPGRYDDGIESTPIVILKKTIQNEKLRQNLVTLFNDKDSKYSTALQREIQSIPGIESLKYPPVVTNEEVSEDMVRRFEESQMIPSLVFADPFGYKGISRKLIASVIKDWGCECIFFFNYNRVNAGIQNDCVNELIDELFGTQRSVELRARLSHFFTRLGAFGQVIRGIFAMSGRTLQMILLFHQAAFPVQFQ